MSEKCPLGDGLHWDYDSHQAIPEICVVQCEQKWDAAMQGAPDDIDTFDPNCEHDVEHGGVSLQRTGEVRNDERYVGVLSICMKNGDDVFAEEYSFKCPFEK